MEQTMYTDIYRIINDTGCKTVPGTLFFGSHGQVLSMLSALITLAVNQASLKVRGWDVWAFRETPQPVHGQDFYMKSDIVCGGCVDGSVLLITNWSSTSGRKNWGKKTFFDSDDLTVVTPWFQCHKEHSHWELCRHFFIFKPFSANRT